MPKITIRTLFILFLIAGIAGAIWFFDVRSYLTLAFLQEQTAYLHSFVDSCYVCMLLGYVAAYSIMVACLIPGVGPATLLGGYLFGAYVGTIAALTALGIGITVSFLVIRYLLASFLPSRWHKRRDAFVARIKAYGAWYIFILNVVTVVPFAIINTLAALSDISLVKFLVASMLGSLPMIGMYAFAGRKFAEINSLSELFSPTFIGMLLLLAALSCIPVVIKRLTNMSIDDV